MGSVLSNQTEDYLKMGKKMKSHLSGSEDKNEQAEEQLTSEVEIGKNYMKFFLNCFTIKLSYLCNDKNSKNNLRIIVELKSEFIVCCHG